MSRPKHELRCIPFDPLGFEQLVADACGADHESEQVKYLAAYFRHGGLDVLTVVVEYPYVDRHYMEEFSHYYASAFRPPTSYTTRLHFFAEEFTDDDLEGWFKDAAMQLCIAGTLTGR